MKAGAEGDLPPGGLPIPRPEHTARLGYATASPPLLAPIAWPSWLGFPKDIACSSAISLRQLGERVVATAERVEEPAIDPLLRKRGQRVERFAIDHLTQRVPK